MKTFWITIPALLILMLLIHGCNLNRLKKAAQEAVAPVKIDSDDGSCQITVPPLWGSQTSEREQGVILQATDAVSGASVIVRRYLKSDYADGLTLDGYVTSMRDGFSERIENAEMTPSVSVTVDGKDARQFELSGVSRQAKVKYLYLIVESPDSFYVIVAWGLPSVYTKNYPEMSEAVHSFKTLAGGGPTPAKDAKPLEKIPKIEQ